MNIFFLLVKEVILAGIAHHTFKGNKCVIYFVYDLFPFAINPQPPISLAGYAFISCLFIRAINKMEVQEVKLSYLM